MHRWRVHNKTRKEEEKETKKDQYYGAVTVQDQLK